MSFGLNNLFKWHGVQSGSSSLSGRTRAPLERVVIASAAGAGSGFRTSGVCRGPFHTRKNAKT